MNRVFFLAIATLFVGTLQAQNIVGKWKTIDDETNKTRSVVEIYEKNGKYHGKIVKLYREPGEEPDPICEKCPGNRKDQKVIGLKIITNMVYDQDDKEYVDGEILDPENGKIYSCKIWVDQGKLKVRGYLYFLYRTQTWLPVKA